MSLALVLWASIDSVMSLHLLYILQALTLLCGNSSVLNGKCRFSTFYGFYFALLSLELYLEVQHICSLWGAYILLDMKSTETNAKPNSVLKCLRRFVLASKW